MIDSIVQQAASQVENEAYEAQPQGQVLQVENATVEDDSKAYEASNLMGQNQVQPGPVIAQNAAPQFPAEPMVPQNTQQEVAQEQQEEENPENLPDVFPQYDTSKFTKVEAQPDVSAGAQQNAQDALWEAYYKEHPEARPAAAAVPVAPVQPVQAQPAQYQPVQNAGMQQAIPQQFGQQAVQQAMPQQPAMQQQYAAQQPMMQQPVMQQQAAYQQPLQQQVRSAGYQQPVYQQQPAQPQNW